ncbi:MAG: sugar nucleotide-binding protein [Methylacidiphilales bacterium]|nr:sugar nucleotide-binding protein [Candidatus Methylacidiphilales bacterium]
MNRMFLVIGSSGYVGSAFRRYLGTNNLPHTCLSLKNPSRPHREVLTEALKNCRPDFVISAAGYVGTPNVDATETHKLECLDANISIPVLIADVCREHGVPFGHVSTGCVYSGSKPGGAGFNEDDPPNFDFRHNNSGFYSGCKALAEEMLAEYPAVYIWRLRYPYSAFNHPKNYLSKLLRYSTLVEARNSISEIEEFAAACVQCHLKKIPFGKYNITNPGSVTTREVVALLQKYNMAPGKEFRFFADEAEFLRTAAKVPRANCVLDSSRITGRGIHLTEVHEAIESCLKNWRA